MLVDGLEHDVVPDDDDALRDQLRPHLAAGDRHHDERRVRDLPGPADRRCVRPQLRWLAPATVAGIAVGFAFACGSGGGFVDAPKAEPPPPPGTLAVDWSIHHAGGSAATCTEAGAMLVVVTMQGQTMGGTSSQTFNCALGGAITGAINPGVYDVGFALVGTGSGSGSASTLATGAPQTGVVIQSELTTRVTPVVFSVP